MNNHQEGATLPCFSSFLMYASKFHSAHTQIAILTRKFMGWRLYIFIKSPSYENDSDTKSGKDKQQAEVDNLSDIARG